MYKTSFTIDAAKKERYSRAQWREATEPDRSNTVRLYRLDRKRTDQRSIAIRVTFRARITAYGLEAQRSSPTLADTGY